MSDENKEFELIRAFHIDNGELDESPKNECFVLGYELGQIDELLKHEKKQFERPVHSDNRERIEESCQDSGRRFRLVWQSCDPSESWMWLSVASVEEEAQ